MDDVPHVTIPIPPSGPFDDFPHYMSVPNEVVYRTIDVLRCYLAAWRPPEGIDAEDQAANALGAAAAQALAGLMDAHAAHNRLHGAPELLDQLHDFLSSPFARADLEALGEDKRDIEALLTIVAGYEELHRSRSVPTGTEHRQQPATARDPGWEF